MSWLYSHIGAPILMGWGASKEVGLKAKELGCRKVFLVHDQNLKDIGLLDDIINSLEEQQIQYCSFDGVQPDPPDVVVEAAAELARNQQIDGIIAVGGGSAIDTAKAVNVLMRNPSPIHQYLRPGLTLNPGVPSIFIPTTAGTDSEVTSISVITDTLHDQEKRSVNNPVCLASLAVIDPQLMMGMPPSLTASTGMDAFAHAAEALTCAMANPLMNAFCREAIRMISQNLSKAVKDGRNREARENMAYASTIAGIAFTNVRVHVGHSIGHVLGAAYHVPHGVACAIAIPPVIRWASKWVPQQVRMIGEAMGCQIPQDASDAEIGKITADGIQKLKHEIQIPSMKDLGFDWETVKNLVPLIRQQGAFVAKPGEISDEELLAILQEAYEQ